jgi:hypothetical protein
VDSKEQAWDEDDVVLFLWENTEAAQERQLKRVGERTRRMEQWRRGVAEGANLS